MNNAEKAEKLQLMVERLHGYLRTDFRYGDHFLPAPFMIEFTGSPDSGKTTKPANANSVRSSKHRDQIGSRFYFAKKRRPMMGGVFLRMFA